MSSSARSGRQPFSLFLNVGGKSDTTSNVTVPAPSVDISTRPLGSLCVAVIVAVYFCQFFVSLPSIGAMSYTFSPVASVSDTARLLDSLPLAQNESL